MTPPGNQAGRGRAAVQELPRPGRCVVMGVLNVTPDSFSDGGCFADPVAAVAHGLAMAAAGADYVDVGGESTRPGADRVSSAEECRRVVPVVGELAAAGVRVSIDTTRAEVADAALQAGAVLVNDVSGGLADAGMAPLVAATGVPWVLMHWRGHSRQMYAAAHYGDVVAEVCAELAARVEDALAAGVAPAQLVLDPGLGFAKNAGHNWALLAGLDQLVDLGFPVLLGASRKTFLGRLLAGPDGPPRPPEQRDAATLATTVLAAAAGVWGVRVHDTGPSADAVRAVAAVHAARTPEQRNSVPDQHSPADRPGPAQRPGSSGGAERLRRAVPDQIAVRGITARAYHGVYAVERDRGQTFRVDAVLDVDTAAAAATDDLAETVNYAELAQQLHAVLTGDPVDLIETLAQRLADVCLASPLVDAVQITVHKPDADLGVPADDVTVSIRRMRPPA